MEPVSEKKLQAVRSKEILELEIKLALVNKTPKQLASEGMAKYGFPYAFLCIGSFVGASIYLEAEAITVIAGIVMVMIKGLMDNFKIILEGK